MKTRKLYFAALVMMTGFVTSATADGSTSLENITGSATVMQAISVVPSQNLNLGMVSPNVDKTIDLTGKTTGGQNGNGTEAAGRFVVSAGIGTDVVIEFTTLPTNLMFGTEELPISYTAGYHGSIPTVGVAFPGTTFVPTSSYNVNAGVFPTNTISSANAIYVFLGATVAPTEDQAAGLYQETITLTATYN